MTAEAITAGVFVDPLLGDRSVPYSLVVEQSILADGAYLGTMQRINGIWKDDFPLIMDN